jgi:hypothetical protein
LTKASIGAISSAVAERVPDVVVVSRVEVVVVVVGAAVVAVAWCSTRVVEEPSRVSDASSVEGEVASACAADESPELQDARTNAMTTTVSQAPYVLTETPFVAYSWECPARLED